MIILLCIIVVVSKVKESKYTVAERTIIYQKRPEYHEMNNQFKVWKDSEKVPSQVTVCDLLHNYKNSLNNYLNQWCIQDFILEGAAPYTPRVNL